MVHFDLTGDPIRVPIEAELDLHAFSPRDIRSVVEEYVSAAAAAGLREVRIVHGRAAEYRGVWYKRPSIVTPRSQNSGTIPPLTSVPPSRGSRLRDQTPEGSNKRERLP
jgi:hypothetical protein